MPKTVGGSRSCLRRIVRKHGPTQDGRMPCKNWFEWLQHMKKKDEKRKNGGDASANGGEDD